MILGSFLEPKPVLRHKLDSRIGGVLGICFLYLSPLLHFVYLLHPLLSLQTSISSYSLHQVESGPDRVTDIMYMGSGIGKTQLLFWSHLNCKIGLLKSGIHSVSLPPRPPIMVSNALKGRRGQIWPRHIDKAMARGRGTY